MPTMIFARLLRRPGRPTEFFLTVLLATTGITVLPRPSAVEVAAVDRTSPVLLVVLLVVCAAFLANVAAAAVRERGLELAVLACVGWPGRSLAALFLGEICLVGFLAGAVGAMLARPVSRALGSQESRPWLVVSVAVGLCLVAAAVPALRAGRAHPVALTNSCARARRRPGRRRHMVGLAMANLARRPGRTVLGVACLAGGIGALTLVAATVWAFPGTDTATLLGDPVPVRVRSADLVAVLATVTVGAIAVADVLLVSTRDRAAELAVLRATGWSDAALARLVAYEGLGIGVIGVAVGVAAGLWGAAKLGIGVSGRLPLTAVTSAVAGLVMVGLAAVVPALRQRRMPMSELLAEE